MITITECEKDGLQEIMNISMGQAANALARLIQTQVSLSVPAIKSMSPVDFNQTITSFPDCWFASQSFMGCIEGEIITGIQKTGCDPLAQAMDFDLPLDKVSTEELVLEVTNILAGACIQGLTSQLELSAQLNMPAFYYPNKAATSSDWTSILMIEIDFSIKHMHFSSHVLIGLQEDSIEQLLLPIRAMLED